MSKGSPKMHCIHHGAWLRFLKIRRAQRDRITDEEAALVTRLKLESTVR